jgi:AcrR family transcriptional regulator
MSNSLMDTLRRLGDVDMPRTTKARTDKGKSRTFIENARRAQIVEAATETIAELGHARASFAQIAKRAGLSSTGLISYHFADKDELIEQVVVTIYSAMAQFMAQRMEGQSSASGALRAYIEANVAFIGTHRTQMQALLDIFMHGGLHYDTTTEQEVLSPVEAILRQGQEAGEFRAFDTRVVATVIQRAIDGLPFLLAATPDLDVNVYSHEVATLFDLATRRTN